MHMNPTQEELQATAVHNEAFHISQCSTNTLRRKHDNYIHTHQFSSYRTEHVCQKKTMYESMNF